MKILYICPDLGIPVLGRKGAAVHVRELSKAFLRTGHQVVLAAQMLNKSPWEKPVEIDFPVLQIRPEPGAGGAVQALKEFNGLLGIQNSLPGELRRILYNREVLLDLTRRFENDPPDFIYERASLYATGGVCVAKALQVPLLLETNAPLALEQGAYRATSLGNLAAEAERWTMNSADAVLAVSNELKEHVISLGVPPSRVHVLPNGVNPELFHPAPPDAVLRQSLGLNGGPVMGFVGGLRPWHGIELLPELLERVNACQPGVRLVIAGDGPLRKELEAELHRRGLRPQVIITGLVPHENIAPLIRQFDIALAPYPRPEHAFYFSPLKLFEYMGCGVPVVASAVGQVQEVVKHELNGMLCPAGDVATLAEYCVMLLRDPDLRRQLGNSAARLVHDHYTWDHNAARAVEIFRDLSSART